MKWTSKIKAGALQFVLFMSVVIALLLLTFITLAQTNALFGKKTELLVDTVKSADLGISIALNNNLVLGDSVHIELPTNYPIQVKAIRDYWGIFEKYTVVASSKKNRFVKTVLAGSTNAESRSALYLADNNRPLIIVGKAKITGEALLPKQGIRPGNIAGNSFYGTTLVHGRQGQSTNRLPQLNSEFLNSVNRLSSTSTLNTNAESVKLTSGLIAMNSFTSPTKIIQGNEIVLSDVSLSGNIIIRANGRIVVEASSQLQDVILSAPEIIVKNNVSGSFQAIASKTIDVGRNCILAYPSALLVNNTNSAEKRSNSIRKPNIEVASNSIVKGVVVYLTKIEEPQNFYPQIKINTAAEIWGEIYCEQSLELKGKVFGSVSTSGFMALESGSIFQNHFFNGTIDSNKLPEAYAGLPIKRNTNFKAIAKWLY